MNCTGCLEALLTADRAEVRGEVEGELLVHLRECTACCHAAMRLEGSTEMLFQMLHARRTARDSKGAVGPSRARLVAMAALPIAAAIIVAVLIRGRNQPLSIEGPRTLTTANGVSIRPPIGHKATVVPSTDPKVTIIWLSNEGGSE